MAPDRLSAGRRSLASQRRLPFTRVGLEAGPLSQRLHAGLVQAGFEVVLLETRHVKAALSVMIVKTDRRDARGIAQLPRMGWFHPVHCKSPPAQEVRYGLAYLDGAVVGYTALLFPQRDNLRTAEVSTVRNRISAISSECW